MSFFRHPQASEPAPSVPDDDSSEDLDAITEASEGVSQSYQKRLDRAAQRSAAGVLARQEIGALPPVADPARREACSKSLALTAKTYFGNTFCDPWAGYHLELIDHFEQIIWNGGQRVVAIERGGGKTVLCLVACLWALINGYRKYAVYVGDTATMGKGLQRDTISLIRSSPKLIEDYPELIVFVKATDNRKKLRCEGRPIFFTLENSDGQTVFPDFLEHPSCQAIINSTGMTGAGGRGNRFVNLHGQTVRPDLLLLDDCQNDESARSTEQTLHREEKIDNSFLGMGGGTTRIAAIMPITVQTNDCLASRYLDRNRHGDWHAMRYEAVPKMPKRMDLWDKFGELLRTGDTPEDGIVAARAFFAQSIDEMLDGAEVSWHRNPPGDIHPLEKYMRYYYLKPDFFTCEIQQQGRRKAQTERLTRELLQTRVNSLPHQVIPDNTAHLVSFVDTHLELLYWMVCAVSRDLTTAIVDYGTWPEQNTRLFTLRGATQTISRRYEGLPEDEAIIAAHLELDGVLCNQHWRRESGHPIEMGRIGKDVGYKLDPVEKAIRLSAQKHIIRPSLGRTYRAGQPRAHQSKILTKGVDDHTGPDWISRWQKDTNLMRTIFDHNRWKSTAALGLCTTPGARGSITMFGDDCRPHQLLIDHLLAEQRSPDRAHGEEIDIWKNPPSHPDNHWWDCLVGCLVAASQLGALATGQQRHDITTPRREVAIPAWMLGGRR